MSLNLIAFKLIAMEDRLLFGTPSAGHTKCVNGEEELKAFDAKTENDRFTQLLLILAQQHTYKITQSVYKFRESSAEPCQISGPVPRDTREKGISSQPYGSKPRDPRKAKVSSTELQKSDTGTKPRLLAAQDMARYNDMYEQRADKRMDHTQLTLQAINSTDANTNIPVDGKLYDFVNKDENGNWVLTSTPKIFNDKMTQALKYWRSTQKTNVTQEQQTNSNESSSVSET